MVFAFAILMVLVFSNSEYGQHSNGINEYRWVRTVHCKTGLNKTGYSVAPTGVAMLKQVNPDGTVGDLCKN